MKIIGVAYGDKPHSFLKNKKTQDVLGDTSFLKVKSEMQFCYHCGGWCFIDMSPCPVCLGHGSVRVTVPLVEEWALTE